MGNDITRIVPLQIYPVEFYVNDLNLCKYEKTLRTTRFMKVARVVHDEGYLVIKVFVIQDNVHLSQQYGIELHNILKLLYNEAPNCQPYQIIQQKHRAAYLIRQYYKYNLFERLVNRPQLSKIEKVFIVFQILTALNQCHGMNVCHGDLKLQNVLLTSWNWVVISDFAPFKPVYIPNDDPSLFYYFFDLADLNVCYLAPERFVSSSVFNKDEFLQTRFVSSPKEKNVVNDNPQEEPLESILEPEMDVFSAGCIIYEIFTGSALFSLSQHLSYQKNQYCVKNCLTNLEPNIREMVSSMIARNPAQRLLPVDILNKFTDCVFPSFFPTLLRDFETFSSNCIYTPDEKLVKISTILDRMIKHGYAPTRDSCNVENTPMILLVPLVTSNVSSCKYVHSKLALMCLLERLIDHLPDHVILDRIIPNLVEMSRDVFVPVRLFSLKTILECFKCIHILTLNNDKIFLHYLLYKLSHFEKDSSKTVQLEYINFLVNLSKEAERLLEKKFEFQIENEYEIAEENVTSLSKNDSFQSLPSTTQHSRVRGISCASQSAASCISKDQKEESYQDCLNLLRKTFLEPLQLFLNRNDIEIRSQLMINSLQICTFLGYEMATSTVLSHIMTYLNLFNAFILKELFFKYISNICSYFGWQYVSYIDAMFIDGLYDNCSLVVVMALKCLCNLSDSGILTTCVVKNVCEAVSFLLFHPNDWIRIEAVFCFYSFSRRLNVADNYYYLFRKMEPFLKTRMVFKLESVDHLFSIIVDALPEKVYSTLLEKEDLMSEFLACVKSEFNLGVTNVVNDAYLSLNGVLQAQLKKHEQLIVFMKHLILRNSSVKRKKIKYLSFTSDTKFTNYEAKNYIITELVKPNILLREANLEQHAKKLNLPENLQVSPTDTDVNSVWQDIFSQVPIQYDTGDAVKIDSKSLSTFATNKDIGQENLFTSLNSEMSMQFQKNKKIISPDVGTIRNLIDSKTLEYLYAKNVENLNTKNEMKFKDNHFSKWWSPKGICLCHMHEHSNSINKLVYNETSKLVGSCSNDGTAKLWAVSGETGPKPCSIATFRRLTSRRRSINSRMDISLVRANSMDFLKFFPGMVVLFDNNLLEVFDYGDTAKCATKFKFNRNEQGDIMAVKSYTSGMSSIIACYSTHSDIYGWDRRMEKASWRAKIDPEMGFITCFDIDDKGRWMSAGTSEGVIQSWDLRYFSPLDFYKPEFKTPLPIYNIQTQGPSWLLYSHRRNKDINIYNVKTCTHMYHINLCDFSLKTKAKNEILTMTKFHYFPSLLNEESPLGYILCSGSDRRIRYLDLNDQSKMSKLVVYNTEDERTRAKFDYDYSDGQKCKVLNEFVFDGKTVNSMQFPEEPLPFGHYSSCHHDSITDIKFIENEVNENMFVSSGRDGVINFWV